MNCALHMESLTHSSPYSLCLTTPYGLLHSSSLAARLECLATHCSICRTLPPLIPPLAAATAANTYADVGGGCP